MTPAREEIVKRLLLSGRSSHLYIPRAWMKKLGIEEQDLVTMRLTENGIEITRKLKRDKLPCR